MVKVSVAGASGYGGGELVRWLLRHPQADLVHLAAGRQAGRAMREVFPHLLGFTEADLVETDWRRLGSDSEVVFLSLPHGLAMEAVPILLEQGARVIDLGADYRLRDVAEYRRFYGLEHEQPALLDEAVYGLPELPGQAERIAAARLVANPGCYPTAAILSVAPVLRELGDSIGDTVVVDAKSGVSGAGRDPALERLFCEVEGGVSAYKVGTHRHTPEMAQGMGMASGRRPRVFFTPHLIPMSRGIASSVYLTCPSAPSTDELLGILREAYRSQPFVRVRESEPRTHEVRGTNLVDLSVRTDREAGVICALAAIDNLGKGAAGQALQNFNLMLGRPATEGLDQPPAYP